MERTFEFPPNRIWRAFFCLNSLFPRAKALAGPSTSQISTFSFFPSHWNSKQAQPVQLISFSLCGVSDSIGWSKDLAAVVLLVEESGCCAFWVAVLEKHLMHCNQSFQY
ncbi:hypothetical protein Pyn_34297 [Prunus yedoensis var. nudiflora]|uniref:Uncharacterized protein n=1 Tax=Prunus yedoensis var. nudiflora TaxID=2094558 RepID=A0A314YZX4_PRUYE|nr:hypothetical protein Pyn_34297 [Prunus yedoensis var. nudiflora]